jgi:hypothetical protein
LCRIFEVAVRDVARSLAATLLSIDLSPSEAAYLLIRSYEYLSRAQRYVNLPKYFEEAVSVTDICHQIAKGMIVDASNVNPAQRIETFREAIKNGNLEEISRKRLT